MKLSKLFFKNAKVKPRLTADGSDLPAKDLIYRKLEENYLVMDSILGKSSDAVLRRFKIGTGGNLEAMVCYIDGFVSGPMVNQHVIHALMSTDALRHKVKLRGKAAILHIKERMLTTARIKEENSFGKIVDAILSGSVALFVDTCDKAILVELRSWEKRSVGEPDTEGVIRGPRESFNEDIYTNMTLLRRKIRNPNLVYETIQLGKQTHTKICIAYIEGIANRELVEEVKQRLNKINTDSILETGYIEQFIDDNPMSPFPTLMSSEKSDVIASKVLEGRVAIICDGTPFVMTAPTMFMEFFISAEDYYLKPYIATLMRVLRFMSLFVAIAIPAIYVSLQTYHQEMLPSVLLVTMAASREGIPFPTFVETAISLLLFDLIREAGIRMPKTIGPALSIVGALIVGEQAVSAGFISSPAAIITGVTGITSLIIPSLLNVIIFSRIFLLVLSGVFGFYGIVVGMLIVLAHMCSLKSFNIYFLTPFAPTVWSDLKDTVLKAPLRAMKKRPESLEPEDLKRQNGK